MGGILIVGFRGGIASTGYIPALKAAGVAKKEIYGNFFRGKEQPPLEWLIEKKHPTHIIIATPSNTHFGILKRVLNKLKEMNLGNTKIILEKPAVSTLDEVTLLKDLLNNSSLTKWIFGLDHWLVRAPALLYALKGKEYTQSHFPELAKQITVSEGNFNSTYNFGINDIESIKGYLIEPSGIDEQGNPVALNFATQEIDPRELAGGFHHPDGVILDTATHPLALIRELLSHLSSVQVEPLIQLTPKQITDRFGNAIAKNDFQTAEGYAELETTLGDIPVAIEVNKYGQNINRKGLKINFKNGSSLVLERVDNADQITLFDRNQSVLGKLQLTGPLYNHLVSSFLLGASNVFNMPSVGSTGLTLAVETTRRRLEEVEALLNVHKTTRG